MYPFEEKGMYKKHIIREFTFLDDSDYNKNLLVPDRTKRSG